MPMNAALLKAAIMGDLTAVFTACENGSGLEGTDYADKIAGIIALRVVEHITANAEVQGTAAGAIPVTGKVL